jgi:murein DD-endopeptidase MepM/ murein hydrolase activator NlpD
MPTAASRHRTGPRRRLRRFQAAAALAVAVSAALATVALVPGAAQAADPVAEAEARRAAAARAAATAAERVDAATSRYFELDTTITTARQHIEAARAEAERLRTLATEQAVEIYTGQRTDFETMLDSATVLDAVRRDQMLSGVNQINEDAVDQLGAVTAALEDREHELTAARAAQAKVVDQMKALEADLRDRLAEADAALLRERVEKARRDAAAAVALRRISSARTTGRAGQIVVNPGGGGFVCPVQGAVAFSDSYGAPRSGGRRHQGVDMMAARGTPVVAVVAGAITTRTGGLGGNAIWLRGANGTTYYYAHLDHFTGGSRSVSAGELIGAVGNTGNADGGPPHLHFEIHPGGGGAINPTPTVRRYC